jgi:conjugative transfer pilus assembly protein TraH
MGKLRRKLRKKQQVMVAACLLAGAVTFGTVAYADFADDWVSQTSGTKPGYFQGSQRGYFTGGSFSARWPASNDSLVTISKPSLKSGCGGIDAFMGGMSFLDADYLVEKLQRILAAAPAAAFDIALKTLAPQVSDTIKGLEAIVDKLNNLQLDDCKAGKALVATIADQSPWKNDAINAEIESAQSDFMVSSGASAMSDKAKKLWKGEFKTGTGASATSKAATQGALAGCPATLKQIFSGGSVLSSLGQMRGLPVSYTNTIRGFIGDVLVSSADDTGSTIKAVYSPPCGKNTFASVVDGTAQIKTPEGVCKDSTDTNRNLTLYITNRFTTAMTSIKNRTALSSDDIALLKSIPLPVLPALKAAVLTGNEAAVIGKLADVSAKGMAYSMMLDIVIRIQQMQDYAKQVQSAQDSADGAAPETCQMALLTAPIERMSELEKNTTSKLREAQHEYSVAVAEAQSIDALVASLEKFSNIARQQISARFGRGVADRAVN